MREHINYDYSNKNITKNRQPINSKPITISWKGFRSEGITQYTRLSGMKEIINNVVVDDYHGTKINVQIVIDTSRKLLIITDDFEGFEEPQVRLPGAMNLGQSFKTSAILSEHGRGLKTAINYFGDIQVIRTSSDTYDFYESSFLPHLEFLKRFYYQQLL